MLGVGRGLYKISSEAYDSEHDEWMCCSIVVQLLLDCCQIAVKLPLKDAVASSNDIRMLANSMTTILASRMTSCVVQS